MDKYRRVTSKKEHAPSAENELRITAPGKIKDYVTKGKALLDGGTHFHIEIKAMGQAISKAVNVAEVLKRSMPGLYTNTTIFSVEVKDTWVPIEEGLDPIETVRVIPAVCITISQDKAGLSGPGYQEPVDPSEVRSTSEELNEFMKKLNDEQGPRRGRGRMSRGGGRRPPRGEGEEGADLSIEGGRGSGRPRGRGHGRDRGRGRVGESAPAAAAEAEFTA